MALLHETKRINTNPDKENNTTFITHIQKHQKPCKDKLKGLL